MLKIDKLLAASAIAFLALGSSQIHAGEASKQSGQTSGQTVGAQPGTGQPGAGKPVMDDPLSLKVSGETSGSKDDKAKGHSKD